MNNLPREKLIQIIKEQGSNLCDNPLRCKAFLLDYCGEYRGEIKILIEALNEGIAKDLLTISQGTPKESILAKLKNKLIALSFQEEASQWAVETWAIALGIVTESELNDPKGRSSSSYSTISPQTNDETEIQEFTEAENKKRLEAEKQFELERQQLETAKKVKQEEERQQAQNEKINREKQIRIEAERKLKEKEEQERQGLERERLEAKTRRKNGILGLLLGLFLLGVTIIFSLIQNQLQQEKVETEVTNNEPSFSVPPEQIIEKINVNDANLIIAMLYHALSDKNWDQARQMYIMTLEPTFNSKFFSQFEKVTLDSLQVLGEDDSSIIFQGQNTYYYADGSTQQELRSYTVENVNGFLQITDSDFIKVIKFR